MKSSTIFVIVILLCVVPFYAKAQNSTDVNQDSYYHLGSTSDYYLGGSDLSGRLIRSGLSSGPPIIVGTDGEYLGRYSRNQFDPNSTSNPFGRYGSEFSPESINNPFGKYGNQFSPDGVRNPFTTGGPNLYGSDGQYLGRLNSNRFDPESVSNPFGRYGSSFSPTSINNPYSQYGSPFSPNSATNPYSASPDPPDDFLDLDE